MSRSTKKEEDGPRQPDFEVTRTIGGPKETPPEAPVPAMPKGVKRTVRGNLREDR